MHTGMLWYDNDPHSTLELKIHKAAQYYKQKYGRLPDLCLVHPNMLSGRKDESKEKGRAHSDAVGITVRPYRPVLPGHIWIGVEDQA